MLPTYVMYKSNVGSRAGKFFQHPTLCQPLNNCFKMTKLSCLLCCFFSVLHREPFFYLETKSQSIRPAGMKGANLYLRSFQVRLKHLLSAEQWNTEKQMDQIKIEKISV